MKSFFLRSNKIIIFFIFLALLTFFLYFSNLTAHFVSDDFGWIITSQNRNPLTFFVASSQSQTNSGNYSPLINLIFYFSFYLSGLNPLFYHLISLLFHFGNIILLYFITKKLISKKVALLACLIFSVYFNNSEAVAWIAAISHVVSTFFYLLSVFLCFKFLEHRKLSFYFISLISFFLALLAKEIAISLPFVIAIIYFIQKMRGKIKDSRNDFLFYWFFYLGILFFYLFLRYYNTGIIFGYYSQNSFDLNLSQYFRNFFIFFVSFFSTNQWRVGLLALIKNHFKEIYLTCLFFGIFLGVVLQKSFFTFAVKVLLFSATLSPYLFLSMNPLNNEGERYLYLPVIVLLVFLASSLVKLKERFPKLILLVIILGVFGSAYLLYEKNKVWRQSGEISEKIITDFSLQVDLTKKNEGVVFLYLPDNLSGAQIFRNAIREAIKFNYPNYQLDAIVLPVSIILSPANWQNHLLTWENLGSNKFSGKTDKGQKLITGMGQGESDDLIFRLEGYDDDYFISNTIYFEIKDSLAKSMKEKKIYFLYFNEGGLKNLEL